MTRRQALAAGGAVVAGTASMGTAAAETNYRDGIPDDVTVTFDESLLAEYKPLLDASPSRLKVTPSSWYGWVSRSADRDLTALSYWCYYPNQIGLTGADSHYLDREPVVVFIDEAAGTIERVNYSAYHWLKGETRTPPLYQGTHPAFRVVERWHHYVPDYQQAGTLDLQLEYLDDVIDGWLNTGWDDGDGEDIQPGIAHAPWMLRDRGSWWESDVTQFVNQTILSIGQTTGLNISGAASEVEQ